MGAQLDCLQVVVESHGDLVGEQLTRSIVLFPSLIVSVAACTASNSRPTTSTAAIESRRQQSILWESVSKSASVW
jgi:hypothetical protein